LAHSKIRQQPNTIKQGRRLSARILDVSSLDADTIRAMFDLYMCYYEATTRELFSADLLAKDQVILLYDDTSILRGFSTLKLIDSQWNGQPYRVIFSGDTIVHHLFWGEQALAFTWIRRAGEIKAEQPNTPLYYLLIVKGHRTYRYLQAFTLTYYPHWKNVTPKFMQGLMDQLGERMFSQYYRHDKGVVHFSVSRGQLRPEWAEPSNEVRRRPEVQFFLKKNPGYRLGDELLCLTELCSDNLRPLSRRLFEAGMNG